MSKHTPGPWLIAAGTTVYALNAHGYNRFSAQAQRGHTSDKWPTDEEELEANARLIAAAPELLEALKDCSEYLSDIPESAVGGDDEAGRINRRAIAAIRKATGQ